jgi:hypothetical protein
MDEILDKAHFYVDEAGDLTLLGRRGKNMIGSEGVSRTFMVGMVRIPDAERACEELQALRQRLLADPYFKSIPSMNPEAGKTARCFHAKDDCPEVRMEVFKFLASHEFEVQVGIRRKTVLFEAARQAKDRRTRLDSNAIYDDLVKTLFKRSLHKAEQNVICFARRGKSSREKSLALAIQRAKANFERDTGIASRARENIASKVPSESPGLQVIDYFLWALQRFYERGEYRFFEFLSQKYKLIMDFDDKRTGKSYGTWFSDRNPLTPKTIMPVAS